MVTLYHKNPCLGVMIDINDFGRPFIGHHHHILNLSDSCSIVDKKRSKNIAFSLNGQNMPQHKNPCPGCHEIYNFGRSFLGHH